MTVALRLILLSVILISSVAGAATVSNVRVWPAPDHTRLVFDMSGPVDHKVFALSKPDRLVIDISQASLETDFTAVSYEGTPIQRIRSARRGSKDLRVVLDLRESVNPKSFALQPNDQYGHRLVIDLYGSGGAQQVKKQADDHAQKRDIVVVIDAGHGGEDPGALGPKGIREKDVVLAISRELQALLDQERGFSSRLTRKGDYFIPLRNRTALAREYNADLLVSVHADAFKSPDASGASVYALSKRGATSETARWLAEKENTSDLIGGVGGVSLEDKDQVLAGVLLDLSMTASLKASLTVGDSVLRSVSGVSRLHKKRVEQAGFVVLKSPDIPSILVETGFISNPSEAQRLKTSKYQKKIATAIYGGLQKYFVDAPPPGTLLAWQKQSGQGKVGQTYVIEKGDTLSSIAQRNNISLNDLMNHNGLTTESLRIGQVLMIPAT
ncbi:AMIN domain-containing protein [Hahella sp. KA22]|uniref:N-acetylmuramoyl-L-alanine amidase n=1 Tax=Hahella sp. KA22 TaxID=1628392 RepID=UPI000FDE49C4|nr:N-acetylmuramoyl-L-alanine amidase [Hahella sp. KA22]AZZ90800.1 AMIN domain-containing protein [Hahella sp. KA22]QAY54170.1 AMIN domain-containing protein [Hahella sp. KA22]